MDFKVSMLQNYPIIEIEIISLQFKLQVHKDHNHLIINLTTGKIHMKRAVHN